jgi:hypothetical protein
MLLHLRNEEGSARRSLHHDVLFRTDTAACASLGKLEASLSFAPVHLPSPGPLGWRRTAAPLGRHGAGGGVEEELHSRALTSPLHGSTRPPPSRRRFGWRRARFAEVVLDSRRRAVTRGSSASTSPRHSCWARHSASRTAPTTPDSPSLSPSARRQPRQRV